VSKEIKIMRRQAIESSWELTASPKLKKRRSQVNRARLLGTRVYCKKHGWDCHFGFDENTGSHSRPTIILDAAKLVAETVAAQKNPFLYDEKGDSSKNEGNFVKRVLAKMGYGPKTMRTGRGIDYKRAVRGPSKNLAGNYAATFLRNEIARNYKPVAVEAPYTAPRKEYYRGTVKSVEGHNVLATVSKPDDWDRWDAYIPLASFDRIPEKDQEFSCTVKINGSTIDVQAQLLPGKSSRTLEDYGIDKDELLDWASKINL
jgi:hypothetical protein